MNHSSDHLPTVRQIRPLVLIGANATKENESLRRNNRTGEYYARDRLDWIIERREGELDGVSHSLGMRIGKLATTAAANVWQLEYYDSLHVERSLGAAAKSTTRDDSRDAA